ncbi:thiamine biosynthesis protein thio [Kiloniella litopenaei]|uniref:D-amino-acid oxidase n=1 Tax=Kiloniella litopenaei TaxID=1549748 RepID=A0A0M2RBP3_9PROT|nr:FAD-dependent oxidoreductase [Kiloniella litopenaei]KKJ77420.1 thiamine biosynthesis protein thio [Kiloniella litopenaei]
MPSIEIIGSGIVGLSCAAFFAEKNCDVTVISSSNGPDENCCSWWAGGMLAPWCEMESAEPLIGELGLESMKFWKQFTSSYQQQGTLVVATSRDLPDLKRFGRRTNNWQQVKQDQIATLEPDLADRFTTGLYYPDEAHFDPRQVLPELVTHLKNKGVKFCTQTSFSKQELEAPSKADHRIDCRGLAAQDHLDELRGVKGEMLLIKSNEVKLSRPVRLLHPRIPLYIVPRDNGLFMVGATMLENENRSGATVRSVLELLSAAYALHPAFGEAEIIEIGVDARPAFPDNLPRIIHRGKTTYLNGMYRHGYLAAPAMAKQLVEQVLRLNTTSEQSNEPAHFTGNM